VVSLTRISPGLLGAAAGGLFGYLWITYEWRVFLLFLFIGIGYVGGKLFESEELREKLRDLFEAIIR
jgi:hypothetical protein